MKENNLPTTNTSNKERLVIASLLNLIKELKTQLESSHEVRLSNSHNDEDCSQCQTIQSAKTMLALHKS